MTDPRSSSCSLRELADFLALTPRRVQQLAGDGVIPKDERGRYRFVDAVRGYIKYLQDRGEGRSEEDGPAINQRERLVRAQADRAELELRQLNGDLVSRVGVGAALATKLIAAGELLRTIPDRYAAEFAAEKRVNVIHGVLTAEIRAAMRAIAAPPDATH